MDYSKNKEFIDKQVNLIDLSNKFFKGSKPLDGEYLEVLNKTFEKSLKKYPTRLNRK